MDMVELAKEVYEAAVELQKEIPFTMEGALDIMKIAALMELAKAVRGVDTNTVSEALNCVANAIFVRG